MSRYFSVCSRWGGFPWSLLCCVALIPHVSRHKAAISRPSRESGKNKTLQSPSSGGMLEHIWKDLTHKAGPSPRHGSSDSPGPGSAGPKNYRKQADKKHKMTAGIKAPTRPFSAAFQQPCSQGWNDSLCLPETLTFFCLVMLLLAPATTTNLSEGHIFPPENHCTYLCFQLLF